jgi:NhaP-type Na+/H+ or K+/H+ antiporter
MMMLSIIGLIIVGAVIGLGVYFLIQNVTLKRNKRK